MRKYIVMALASLSFAISAADKPLDCGSAITTLEINQCASIKLELARIELAKYLETIFEHNDNDPELIESIKVAQKDWEFYISSHCSSIHTKWRDGSIRGVMYILCQTKMTEQRTHEIWSSFLTYIDSTPPVLPEPKE